MSTNFSTRNTEYFPPILSSVITILMLLFFNEAEAGNNYYFSSSTGDDSRTSLQARNPATPWKTITKLNSIFSSLAAGDSVLLKRDDVFEGTITPTISGTLASPIIISSYGTGAKPIISGFKTITGWTSEGSGIYSKAVSVQSMPNMVTINGVNTPIGRYPNTGWLTISSPVTNTKINGSSLNSAVTNWTGSELVIRKNHWVIDRGPISNHTGQTLTYSGTSGYPGLSGYGFFLQNDLKCLTDLGEWAYLSGKLYMYFGAANPSDYTVKVSTLNKLISLTSKSYIKFTNLQLQGSNVASAYLSSSNHITFTNCDIKYSGFDGITANSSDYLSVSYCSIDQTQNNSFDCDTYGGSGDHTYFGYNTVKNSGVIQGMSGNSDGKSFAVSVQTDNSTIEYNVLDSLGYVGIIFEGNSSVVRNNYINHFCLSKDDGAGIYTYQYTALPAITAKRTVADNIVLNGLGAGAGTADGGSAAMGIYMDGYTEKVDILRNTVSNCTFAGLYFYLYANNITIEDNIFYGNSKQIAITRGTSVHNLVFNRNIFATKKNDQRLIDISSTTSPDCILNQVSTWNNNYYLNYFIDDAVMTADYYIGGVRKVKDCSFDMWKASFDVNAKSKPIEISPYTINSLGSNKFANAAFNSSTTGYVLGNGPGSMSWVASSGLDGGGARMSIDPNLAGSVTNTKVNSIGAIDNTKKYIARWSVLSSTNGTINVHLRQSSSPNGYSTPISYYEIKNSRVNKEILLQPKINDATAWLYFVLKAESGTTTFDNIQLYEADVTITNPDDIIRLEYNATNSNKTIILDQTYIKVDGSAISGSITLQPYTSIILLKSAETNSNKTPTIQNQNFQLNENSPNGTTVGTVIAIDPDAGQTKTFSIVSGNTNGAFAISTSSGVLTVSSASALNFEVTPTFALVIKVQDNGTGNLSSQATITVSLTNVNEIPVVANQSFTLAENSVNGTTIGTVVTADPDAGQTKTFSIVSGNTNGAFAINASSGAITVASAAALNYEVTPTFALVIKVQDNGTVSLSSQATITVSLTNVNEIPVVANQSFTLAENSVNGTTIGTVVATDPDAGQTKTFSVVSGNANGAFAISASSGAITVASAATLNYEVTPTFALVIKVQDNGTGNLSSQATITVSLTDANEVPVIANQSFSVNENSVNGTTIGTVVATDPDAGQTRTFSVVSGNTNGAFAINASSGAITVASLATLNYEVTPTFVLVIKVQDNGTGNLSTQATITVSLTDVNEVPAIANQLFSVNENSVNGTTIGTVVATDPDAGQARTFSIVSGNTNGAFAINASTGVLTVADATVLNFEDSPTFALIIKVQDNGTGNLNSQAPITVSLSDINEIPVIANQSFSVNENSENGTIVGTIVATDSDAGQTMTFSIVSGNNSGAFSLDAVSGVLTVTNSVALSFSINPLFSLDIKVSDNGTGNLFANSIINVSILPSPNQPPVITDQTFSLSQNSPTGTLVGIVEAADPDAEQLLVYSIESGNASGTFAINPANGEISVANPSALAFKSSSSIELVVKVHDNGSVSLSNQALVTVLILPANAPPVILSQTKSTLEHQPSGTVVGNILASDPDSEGPLQYSITSGNIGSGFALDASSGLLTINNQSVVCYEGNPVFNLSVKVQNVEGLSSEELITVNVADINEIPVCNDQIFSIAENAPIQTAVGTVVAKDYDFNQTLTYSILSGNSDNAFTIDPGNGSIKVNNPASINFEAKENYSLVISVKDNGQGNLAAISTIKIDLVDVNESPVMENQALSVVENSSPGTKIGYLKANDPDKGQKLTYKIASGNESHTFNLNDSSGLVTVADPSKIYYGHNPLFILTVIAQDNGLDSLSTLSVVTINILRDSAQIIQSTEESNPVAEPFNENDISIYPNPTADIVNINLAKAIDQQADIRIFTMTGIEVYSSFTKGEKNVVINMADEKPGTYVAVITIEGIRYSRNIVVQNRN